MRESQSFEIGIGAGPYPIAFLPLWNCSRLDRDLRGTVQRHVFGQVGLVLRILHGSRGIADIGIYAGQCHFFGPVVPNRVARQLETWSNVL